MKKVVCALGLVAVLAAGGCSSSAPAATSTGTKGVSPEQDQLSAKLKGMSPDQRAAYVQSHPDEISKTYSGVQPPAGSGQPQ